MQPGESISRIWSWQAVLPKERIMAEYCYVVSGCNSTYIVHTYALAVCRQLSSYYTIHLKMVKYRSAKILVEKSIFILS